jgi:hypothetical protein
MVQHNREAMIQPVEELAVWTQKKKGGYERFCARQGASTVV